MTIQICAVGGYGEVGKNMTAVKIDNEVVIFDMGLHLPNYIKYTEGEEGNVKLSTQQLIDVKAIPDDSIIEEWADKVVAIIPSHAHLDHIGAIPYLADHYKCPVYCTPFTAAVLKRILLDEKIKIPNEIIPVPVNGKIKISENLTAEFINMTHSTPHTAMVVLHTKYGGVLYGNDFKLDNSPILGKKPNYEALAKVSGLKVAILDSLYAHQHGKTSSEFIAREMLRDIMLGVDFSGKALFVTTFSSHIARLKSTIEFARKLNRKIVILGRSMSKHLGAAQDSALIKLENDIEIVPFSKHVQKRLAQLEKEKDKYVVIATGHQGEPHSVLSKIADDQFQFAFKPGDSIIFSCKVIPVEINIDNRKRLEEKLVKKGVRIFKDIHVSGHGAKEDMRTLISIIKPQFLIPAHSEQMGINEFIDIASEMGYKTGKNVFPLLNTQRQNIE